MVPGEDNTRKLARQVRASFRLPCRLQELDAEEGTLQAPPALPCLCQQRFMLQADSIFASWDIREVPREKVGGICQGPSSIGQSRMIHLLEVSPAH